MISLTSRQRKDRQVVYRESTKHFQAGPAPRMSIGNAPTAAVARAPFRVHRRFETGNPQYPTVAGLLLAVKSSANSTIKFKIQTCQAYVDICLLQPESTSKSVRWCTYLTNPLTVLLYPVAVGESALALLAKNQQRSIMIIGKIVARKVNITIRIDSKATRRRFPSLVCWMKTSCTIPITIGQECTRDSPLASKT